MHACSACNMRPLLRDLFFTCLAFFAAAEAALPRSAMAEPVASTVEITGVSDESLRQKLVSVSELLAPEPPASASLLQLRRRAERDQTRFLEVLQSTAHYSATVDFKMEHDSRPVKLTFEADPGPVYLLGDVQITPQDDAAQASDALPPPDAVGLSSGAPALAENIAAADARILRHLREHGHPVPSIAFRDVVVHKDTQTVAVVYRVDLGPPARFGDLRFDGLEGVHPEVVLGYVPWETNTPYDERALATLRSKLYDTGLFTTVAVSPIVEEIGPGGGVPILVDVLERQQRTISLGLDYKTDTGPGTQAHWENRNLGGLGRRLSVDGVLGTELSQLGMRYRVENYRRSGQTLTFSGEIAREERDAFESSRVTALAMVERRVSEPLTIGVGAGLRVSRVKQAGEEDDFTFVYVPLTTAWDRSNDRLNPTAGFRLNTRTEPYLGVLGGQSLFLKGHAEVSNYIGFGAAKSATNESISSWVLASRLKLGMLVGESLDGVPADVRFYGGGGASIRGYAFQSVSPLKGDTPLGGRSLTEFSVEIRKRITDDFGIVAFVDGGSAFNSPYPDFGAPVKFGAGVGLRYFTPLGPLRFDVAVPLQRREGIDDAFQIYLSIGQAF